MTGQGCIKFKVHDCALAAGADWEPEVKEEGCIRFWSPELLQEGQWHHVVIVLNRAVLKNSSVSIYIDGQHMSTQKVGKFAANVMLLCKHYVVPGFL